MRVSDRPMWALGQASAVAKAWGTAVVSGAGLVIGWRTAGRSVFGWYRHGGPIVANDVDGDGRAVVEVEAGSCLVPRRPTRYERKRLGMMGRRALVIEASTRLPFPDLYRQREIYVPTRVRFVVHSSELVGTRASGDRQPPAYADRLPLYPS